MTIELISVEKAKELIKKNEDDSSFRVLDIRTKEEFSKSHIKGALNIDIYDPRFEEIISKLDRNKTYLVHCKVGGRAGSAGELMKKLGFKEVYVVMGWVLD